MRPDSRLGVGAIFARDVAEHTMRVLKDDGLYRHLRFAKPGTGINHFDLITWPGHLSIGGDRDGYVFARIPDMFEFFRAKSGWNSSTINPQYWAEKLTTRVPVKAYDEGLFRQLVVEYFVDAVRGGDTPKGLGRAIRDEILDDTDIGFEDGARIALRDFEWPYELPADQKPRPPWRFDEHCLWEWDFTDWDFHYLYACHAIQWGIEQYDRWNATRSDRLIVALTS